MLNFGQIWYIRQLIKKFQVRCRLIAKLLLHWVALKMHDLKMKNQVSRYENVGPENKGPNVRA